MAVGTITPVRSHDSRGNHRGTVTTVVLPSVYTGPGGDSLTAAQLGLNVVKHATTQVSIAGTGSVVNAFYDIANSKLKAFTAAAEVANGVDVSAVTVQVTAWGI